jgi:hypothetical protein
MSMTWVDDLGSEADYDSEADFDSEADYDSEADFDSEATRSWRDRDRQARARRLLAQRRIEQARRSRTPVRRPSPVVSAPPTVVQTVKAIRNLDLDTKVSTESLRQDIDLLKKRMDRNGLAFALSQGVDQGLDSFSGRLANHEFIRAGIRLAPALLVAPQKKRRGLEGYLLDPRVLSAIAVGGVLVAGRFDRRTTGVDDIQINVPTPSVGDQDRLLGVAIDRQGRVLNETITWASQNAAVLSVAPDGSFTAVAAGTVLVTASAGGTSRAVFITVIDDNVG